ncbi:helix-turn-helix domain-containing protein [Kibdelosporangium philippinense]|uniref:Helix-turn-helix domain-containing protein n=1 Tax=Kibdelosporangium philippinense TaxID=211113 RepID=A0ABS8ZMW5_9PSEU|nr:helix-turn-helix transcriptional regulator [Kibdelosporangium philippinense]MCE7009050.1 helix-turn-helix domain-containing protein [Kibdelosporangium philippinense]
MAGIAPEPNYYGRKLQRAMKRLREQNLLTQEEAGTRCHIDHKKLSRIERRQLPTYHELIILLDIYGVPSCNYDPYLALWDRARRRGWWRNFLLTKQEIDYIRLEDEADFKCEFQLGRLPWLLQTKSYTRAILARRDEEIIEKRLGIQFRQQKRLTNERQLTLHALIHEPVLRQGVDRTQLRELLTRSEMPNVTLQVVPQIGTHEGLHSSLTLLSFDDKEEPDYAFAETPFGPAEINDPDNVQEVRRILRHVETIALSPNDSVELITNIHDNFRERKLIAVPSG